MIPPRMGRSPESCSGFFFLSFFLSFFICLYISRCPIRRPFRSIARPLWPPPHRCILEPANGRAALMERYQLVPLQSQSAAPPVTDSRRASTHTNKLSRQQRRVFLRPSHPPFSCSIFFFFLRVIAVIGQEDALNIYEPRDRGLQGLNHS